MYSYGPPHMAEQKQDDKLEHTSSSYVRIWDVAQKICQRRWTIGRSGERGSGISAPVAWHDADDDLLHCTFGLIWIQGYFDKISTFLTFLLYLFFNELYSFHGREKYFLSVAEKELFFLASKHLTILFEKSCVLNS